MSLKKIDLFAAAGIYHFAVMASTWLHSSPLSQPHLPFICCRAAFFNITLRRFHQSISTGRLTSAPDRVKPPILEVYAQAKRGFSFKVGEVASPGDLNFKAPLKIVEYPDPILRAKNKRIEAFDDNLKNLVDEMFDVMYKTDGIGISAPQVGVNVQLMVFNPVGERGEGEEIVLVNPRVGKYSKKIVLFDEGCLSFPGIYGDVESPETVKASERPESVKIDARDVTGARFTVNLSGLPARVFQHEFDHLQGILFFDRMTDEVLESIRPELQALEKKYEDNTGNPSPEKIATRQRRKVAAGFTKPYELIKIPGDGSGI